MAALRRILLPAGAIIVIAGALVLLVDRLGLHRLPGTLTFTHGNFTVFDRSPVAPPRATPAQPFR